MRHRQEHLSTGLISNKIKPTRECHNHHHQQSGSGHTYIIPLEYYTLEIGKTSHSVKLATLSKPISLIQKPESSTCFGNYIRGNWEKTSPAIWAFHFPICPDPCVCAYITCSMTTCNERLNVRIILEFLPTNRTRIRIMCFCHTVALIFLDPNSKDLLILGQFLL